MALSVYKASAGTGKTYQLTLAYLTFLLGNPTHFDPHAFYRILAVTFTNKATNQMKTRILDTLALLSKGETSCITEDLCEETGLSHDQLVVRAKIVHKALLHNYSRFSVSTLDAFFQRILQSFVLEAGLAQGYSIDTDTDYLIDKTARRMVAGISKDTSLRQWFIELIHEKWSRSDRWDTLRLLKQTGQQATRESFRIMGEDFAQHIGDRSFLKQTLQTYQNLIYGFENHMAGLGKEALRLIKEQGFSVADFPYKSMSFAAYFQKITALHPAVEVFIPGKRVLAAAEREESLWYNKKSPEGLENLQEVLGSVLEEILEYFNNHYRAYATAVAVKEQIPQMGLLADVITTMRQIQEESNTLDLGDSTYLLSRLVGEGNVPFVYERMGSAYDSFLLDEFQDTSALQWINMYPLVLNGLSQGYDSLMVGDVKQSIYRWRNSDWRILGERIALDPVLRKQGVDFYRLHINYRSSPQVVQFVNHLIDGVSRSLTRELENKLDESSLLEQKDKEYLGQLLKRAYEGYECNTPPRKECSHPNGGSAQEGYVQVNTLYATHEDSAEQRVLQQVQDLLFSLLARGYCPSDILILVRTNAEARTLLSYFLKQKQEGKQDVSDSLQVLTEEALYLAASPYVNLTVALLTLALFPADTCTAEAVSCIALEIGNKDVAKDTEFLEKLKLLPLPDAFEAIIQKMKWSDKAEAFPYLQEFHDTILDFSGKNSGGIYAFLVWWHERGKEKLLSVDTSHQAVRMLTIHKAKGLEAPVVIVPFCNWALDPSGTDNQIIWAGSEHIPFNKPEWLPVRYSSKLKHTYFAKDYYLEYSQRLLDALNLLYVATTRPKQELYVFLPFSKEPSFSHISGHVKEVFFPEESTPENQEWSVGTKNLVQPAVQEDGKATVQPYKLQTYGSGDFSTSLVLAREEANFNYAPHDSRRQWGIVLHKALSRIHSYKDIPAVLEDLVTEGELSGHFEHVKHMAQVLEKSLSAPGVSDWFDGSWLVRTEPTIAGPGGNLRPDRVMEKEGKAVVLDYKFGRPDPAHQEQIDLYVAALQRMGYSQVEGHLLYITLKKNISV